MFNTSKKYLENDTKIMGRNGFIQYFWPILI